MYIHTYKCACVCFGHTYIYICNYECVTLSMESSSEIERSPIRHVPSHWDSLVDLLQHFNYSADWPCRGIASCRWNPSIMGNSLDKASFFICTDLLQAFEWTPPKIKFLILWAAVNGVHRNSLVKSGIFLVFPYLIWVPRWKTDPMKSVRRVFASRSLLWLARGFRRCEYRA